MLANLGPDQAGTFDDSTVAIGTGNALLHPLRTPQRRIAITVTPAFIPASEQSRRVCFTLVES